MKIITEYSLWWLLPIIAGALAFSLLLYYRNRRESFSRVLNIGLTTLRFLVVFLLGIMLLNPLLKTQSVEKQKPVVVILQDQSESLLMNGDTSAIQNTYKQEMDALRAELEKDYELKSYAFGDEELADMDWSFEDKSTDIAWAINEVGQRYGRLNLGAVILASDGIYNKGTHPLYELKDFPRPIYTIALGDTTLRKDIRIQRVAFNEVAYLGNRFPVEVEVRARLLEGQRSRVSLYEEGKKLFSEDITFRSDNDAQVLRFLPEARESGTIAYRVVVDALEDELSTDNNSNRFFVDVIDSKKKVLLLYEAPHPDIGAIHAALRQKDQYDIELAQSATFRKSPEAYNLIITHQLPAQSAASLSVFNRIRRSDVPVLAIVGQKVNLRNWNRLNTAIKIQTQRMQANESFAIENDQFDRFIVPEDFSELLPMLPPLHSPFGKYVSTAGVQSILKQRLGKVNTDYPLAAVTDIQGKKSGYIMGEGIWRWRLYCFAETESHKAFDTWIEKMVQYLSLSEEKKRFSVQVNRKFMENERVVFTAQLFNPSYETVEEAQIDLKIRNEEGEEFTYVFGRRGTRFYLDAGHFPEGRYTYEAQVSYGKEIFEDKGNFRVLPIHLEGLQLTADHMLLQSLSDQTGGSMLYPGQLNSLKEELNTRDDIATVRYEHFRFRDIIDWYWLLLILGLLLSAEWFIRKYSGSY